MKNSIYCKIADDIRDKIIGGELKPGDDLPSEMTLCNEYNTSRMTVRKGLSILSNNSYIYSIPGKGYFVQKPNCNKYTIFYNERNNLINDVDRIKLLSVDVVLPDDKLATNLCISKNRKIIRIRRLFYTQGYAMAYDLKYLIYQRGVPIIENELENATFPEMMSNRTSLYSLNKEIVFYAKMPGEEIKELLKMCDEVALFVVEQKLYDTKDKPIGFGITYFRGDYIKLHGISQ